uniref:Uncharacterized protein n=1 Tax=Chorda asiatica TaxID=1281577 RepID=A0A8F0K0J0_9PHAE|nr:hypothetical protein [Chorda asiatica]
MLKKIKEILEDFYWEHEEFFYNAEERWFFFYKHCIRKINEIHSLEDLWNMLFVPFLHGIAPVVLYAVIVYFFCLDRESQRSVSRYYRRFEKKTVVGIILGFSLLLCSSTFLWEEFILAGNRVGAGVFVYICYLWLFEKVSSIFKYFRSKYKKRSNDKKD